MNQIYLGSLDPVKSVIREITPMKETAEMIELGVDAIQLRETQLHLDKMIKNSKKVIKQLVKAGFREHSFSGGMATLTDAKSALSRVDQMHSDLTDMLTAHGVEMCSDAEFKEVLDKRNLRSGPHR